MTFAVNILGSSSAIPTSRRNPTSLLVNMNYNYFLVDCGEGTQMQLRRYKFRVQKIKHIFISHLHGDHYYGLIGLISTLHLLGRKDELHIYANEQLQQIIDMQLKVSDTKLEFPLFYHPTNYSIPEVIYNDGERFVKSFPLSHRIPTTGFLFGEKPKERKIRKDFIRHVQVPVEQILKIKGGADFIDENGRHYKNEAITLNPPKPRSFAFCSDTAYHEPVIENIMHTDLLYHEATFTNELAQNAREKFHSTAAEAAMIARKAEAGKLIIGHFSARYDDPVELLNEARAIFPDTDPAEDGYEFKILNDKNIIHSKK